ncbi:unnamed protein product [Peniophora sp. CBMAI 1063]|nr:unnamed protein product [Peniophora sp. CBMAI 1063]
MVQTRTHTEGAVFAVHVGRQRGIFLTWREVLKQVKDFEGAIYKKHSTREAAELWLEGYAAKDALKASAQMTTSNYQATRVPLLNALELELNAPTSRENVGKHTVGTTAPAWDMTMDAEDSDDGIPGVRELEELLRRARIKEAAKAKARLGAAAEAEWEHAMDRNASGRVKREDVRVKKEEVVEVDAKTWSMAKVETGVGRPDDRRYTSSEKGKWRAGTSRAPAATASAPVSKEETSKPRQHTRAALETVAAKSEPAPTSATRPAPSAIPTSNHTVSAPPRQARPPSPPLVPTATTERGRKLVTSSTTNTLTAPATSSLSTIARYPAAPGPIIIAYTDGSSRNNQSQASRRAGYGIHWAAGRPAGVPGDISRRLANGMTNNYAELLAIIRTLEYTSSDSRPLKILSDSDYSLKCFLWIVNWRKHGWKKPNGEEIKNLDMIRYMVALQALRAQPAKLEHVPGHAKQGIHRVGNDIADKLASTGADLPESAAEPDTLNDWAQRRASAERRVEEQEKKRKSETVHIDVGGALGLTSEAAAPAANVTATTQAISQMTITAREQETMPKTEGGGSTQQWNRGKLSRQGIMAALHAPLPGPGTATSGPSASTPSQPSSTSNPQPASAPALQPQNPSTPVRASMPSASAPPTATSRASAASTPRTPSRTTARAGGSVATATNRVHTTPVAAGPSKQNGKVIVRVVDEDEYKDDFWNEDDTFEDEEMIAEAMGR